MKYASAAAFRMALEQHLLNLTQEMDLSLARLRKTVVFDRLLARLFASAPDRWVLKGALALDFRLESAGRATKDIDLLRRDTLDISFSDPLQWEPERVRGPDLLRFADIEPTEMPALPLEQQAAEKFHAYTRTYGRGHTSSRAKDLIDLVLIKSYATLDTARLREALVETFRSRALQALPFIVPPPPPDWETAYRKLATEVGIDPALSAGLVEARTLLGRS